MLNKVTWYLNRLRSMSFPEILHRVDEKIKKNTGAKLSSKCEDLSNVDLLPICVNEQYFEKIAPIKATDWHTIVQAAKAGHWSFLGKDWPPVSLDNLWHLDPVSETYWPNSQYCFNINYRHEDSKGDIKYTWEVNRLQILPVAAALWKYNGDKDAQTFALTVLESWIDNNPPYKGVNWSSGIELALRCVNIALCLSLLDPKNLSKGLYQKVLRSLNAHLTWLKRFPSKYSSANNHLISELAAIYIIERLAPELPSCDKTAPVAFRSLMSEILRQLHKDGVGVEQSPTYTCFSLEWVLLAMTVARQFGDYVEPEVVNRLESSAEVLRWMMDDEGNVPRIGDDDQGRVISTGDAHEESYVANILSSLCSSINREDLAPPNSDLHVRNLWLDSAPPNTSNLEGTRFFDHGGYTIFRHRINNRNSMIMMDHGPLGYLSIAAHGHSDALSIWWHLDNQPVLVDCGTYLYHSGGLERNTFRGSALHNTLVIDGKNQSEITGPFNWGRKANSYRAIQRDTNNTECTLGHHDGYSSLGLQHLRRLKLDVNSGYTVYDYLVGSPKTNGMTAELNWHLHPNLDARITDAQSVKLSINEKTIACITIDLEYSKNSARYGHKMPLAIEERPYSPEFGVKRSTLAITCRIGVDALLEHKLRTKIEILEQ